MSKSCGLFFTLFALVVVPASDSFVFARQLNNDSTSFMKLLDSNSDKHLDPYEVFDRMLQIDSEFDGKLTFESLQQAMLKIEQEKEDEAEDILEDLDQNGDGTVHLKEIDAAMREMATMVDTNRDGVISLKEIANADFEEELFLSPQEIEQEVRTIFSELDTNDDGVLSEDEADDDLSWSQICEADSDLNSKVTPKEFKHFLQSDNQTASFTIENDTATMAGVINGETPANVLRLIHEHPSVRTIVMANVPGSIDDEANLRAASFIRKFGFKTIIQSKGRVASGGTDFFLAGETRVVHHGGKLGIHSWGGPGFQGKDVPKDDPQHRLYLDYYEEMGIPAEFYWRTLEAAPANDIHWMTEDELLKYNVRTESNPAEPKNRNSSEKKLGIDSTQKEPAKTEYWATIDVENCNDCMARGGTWFNGKCWANFANDAGIELDDIDEIVAKQMVAINDAKIKIGEKQHQIEFAFPEIEDGKATLIIGFNGMKDNLLVECSEKKILSSGSFRANSVHLVGDIFEADNGAGSLTFAETGMLEVSVKDDFEIEISGTLKGKSDKTIDVFASINDAIIGAGNSKLEIKEGNAFLSGTLGTVTYPQIKSLISEHPEIQTITLTDVEGSVNDSINMHTGRILREAGLNTRVLKNSQIASGGVDLYCSGVRRFGEEGAKVGVHSWGGQGYTGGDLPKDHPDHQFQLAYFGKMLGVSEGKNFYFYTLEAAPFDGVHWMSVDELKKWDVVTEWNE